MKRLGALAFVIALTLPTAAIAELHGSIFFRGEIVEVPCSGVNNNTSALVQCNRKGESPKTLNINLTSTKDQYIDGVKVNSDNIGKGLYTVTLTIA
ncbi:hypothetical protein N1M2_171 [Klebsiella phage N1M2]|uniref:Uncharacterized protein n=1 Tax=Klebsiella phage N1M2 TaxID=2664939 RepID=A0A6B7ZFJ8_9CAUD|nr:hypothetical protein PQB72_gp171 [Klebsiella phage N1M2]QGH72034.1 hypothetical protein N1M2_171 [Klebsiella phage N1M2]